MVRLTVNKPDNQTQKVPSFEELYKPSEGSYQPATVATKEESINANKYSKIPSFEELYHPIAAGTNEVVDKLQRKTEPVDEASSEERAKEVVKIANEAEIATLDADSHYGLLIADPKDVRAEIFDQYQRETSKTPTLDAMGIKQSGIPPKQTSKDSKYYLEQPTGGSSINDPIYKQLWDATKELFTADNTPYVSNDRMYKFDKAFNAIVGQPLRVALKYAKGITFGAPDIMWASLKRALPKDQWEIVKDKNLDEAMDWVAGYNPSGFNQAAGDMAQFVGAINSASALLGKGPGVSREVSTIGDAVGKAAWNALQWGSGTAAMQASKLASEKIDPTESDYGYEGATAVLQDMATAAIFSLVGSGGKALWERQLMKAEKTRVYELLGLNGDESFKEVQIASRRFAKANIENASGDFQNRFADAMQQRIRLLRGESTDVVFRGAKTKVKAPKKLLPDFEQGVAERVAVESEVLSRNALVNRHIAQYQAYQANPTKETLDKIMETRKHIDSLDRISDPLDGRPFVPPEIERLELERKGLINVETPESMKPAPEEMPTLKKPSRKTRKEIKGLKTTAELKESVLRKETKLTPKEIDDKFREYKERQKYDALLEKASTGDMRAVGQLNSLVQGSHLPTYETLLDKATAGDEKAVQDIIDGRYFRGIIPEKKTLIEKVIKHKPLSPRAVTIKINKQLELNKAYNEAKIDLKSKASQIDTGAIYFIEPRFRSDLVGMTVPGNITYKREKGFISWDEVVDPKTGEQFTDPGAFVSALKDANKTTVRAKGINEQAIELASKRDDEAKLLKEMYFANQLGKSNAEIDKIIDEVSSNLEIPEKDRLDYYVSEKRYETPTKKPVETQKKKEPEKKTPPVPADDFSDFFDFLDEADRPPMRRQGGFVDLTPIIRAGEQASKAAGSIQKTTTRFTKLESNIRQSLINVEEQERAIPGIMSKKAVNALGKLNSEDSKDLLLQLEKGTAVGPEAEFYKRGQKQALQWLKEAGKSPNWPQSTINALNKRLGEIKNPETKKKIQDRIDTLEGLQYVRRIYEQPKGVEKVRQGLKRLKTSSKLLKKRSFDTLEEAIKAGYKPRHIAVSYADMMSEAYRVKLHSDLINAINGNPFLAQPEASGPKDWVPIDSRLMEATKDMVYHPAIAEAVEELLWSTPKKHPITKGYDWLNTTIKQLAFYNPFVMVKNDMFQAWRATGSGFATKLTEAVKEVATKGKKYQKLREMGLFNNVVDMVPMAEAITQDMLDSIHKTFGERAAEFASKWIVPTNFVDDIRKFNNLTTWKMDEVLRTAVALDLMEGNVASKAANKLSGGLIMPSFQARNNLTDFEVTEIANDFMANYGKVPKHTRQVLNRFIFTPTYKISMLRMLANMYTKPKKFWPLILRHNAYKLFLRFVLPGVVAMHLLGRKWDEGKLSKGYKITVGTGFGKEKVFSLSDPLLEENKLLNRPLIQSLEYNLAAAPNLILRLFTGPTYFQKLNRGKYKDAPKIVKGLNKYSHLFKLGTPVVNDILSWYDEDKSGAEKFITQMAIAYVYSRKESKKDQDTATEATLKALGLYIDWKDQTEDLKRRGLLKNNEQILQDVSDYVYTGEIEKAIKSTIKLLNQTDEPKDEFHMQNALIREAKNSGPLSWIDPEYRAAYLESLSPEKHKKALKDEREYYLKYREVLIKAMSEWSAKQKDITE